MGEATFGKYRLIAELGHGGMADVFLAVIAGPVGSGFTKLTVIKRLRQNLAEDPEFVEMLVDEARISARLNHPNVVQTNEVGSVGNQYFLAMEYLDGQPLHRVQHRAVQRARRNATPAGNLPASPESSSNVLLASDPFPKECQYLVLIDTLAGLHHAHELFDYDGTPLGIVHRDVTPHNVFVTYEGQVKVVDFGIAKAAGRASETRQGVIKGKIRYMAPEQALGRQLDRRADIFSVGVMLWEAAAGRRLWADMDDLTIVQALIAGTLNSSPRDIDPHVPLEIDRICKKALASNAEDRYATADEFRVDLEQYLAEQGTLTSARRKLAAVVNELFKDKREEIKGVIEKQLAKLQAQTAGEVMPVRIAAESASSASLPSSKSSGSTPVDLGARAGALVSNGDGATEVFTGTQPSSPRKKGRSKLPILLAAATILTGGAVVLRNRVESMNANARRAAATSSLDTTAGEIHLKIMTMPLTAEVTIDQAPVPTPSSVRMPRDRREHTVRVEASGFDPMVETVRFENDVTMNVVLTKAAPAASESARPPGPTESARPAVATSSPPRTRWNAAPPTPKTKSVPAAPPLTPTPNNTPAPVPATTPSHKPAKPGIDNGDPWTSGH